MMRVTLVIASLAGGGAERVLVAMANHWAARDWPVTLITLAAAEAPSAYPLSEKVRRIGLDAMSPSNNPLHGIANNLRRIAALRRALADSAPEAVISFMDRTNVLTLLAARGSGVPVVVSDRIHPILENPGRVFRLLRRIVYPWAAAVAVQTNSARGQYARPIRRRIAVIANPVVLPVPQSAPGERDKTVAAMGRLEPQKGFDLLLRAWALVAGRHPDWTLEIRGEGSLRAGLETLRDSLGLAGRAELPGRHGDPGALFSRAGLFVLSSRYEGFPNVLCEAMACGTPVISFDCPNGPGEIIEDGVNGLLVPPQDVEALAAALERLLDDPGERTRLGEAAQNIRGRLAPERIMGEWEALLARVVGSAGE